jgi:hypothetical protein
MMPLDATPNQFDSQQHITAYQLDENEAHLNYSIVDNTTINIISLVKP